jgi:hypothetical protein
MRGAVYSGKRMAMSLEPIGRKTQFGKKTRDSPQPTVYTVIMWIFG